MEIRATTNSDVPDILAIHRRAFGQDIEANLVQAILQDPSAEPLFSFLAFDDGKPAGHVLFSRIGFTDPQNNLTASILAPLAVVPEVQKRGIGGGLIRAGLVALTEIDTGLVFVFGDPKYYSRFGFTPAGRHGLPALYPIAPEHADAWMVLALKPDILGVVQGTLVCCDELSKPEFWLE